MSFSSSVSKGYIVLNDQMGELNSWGKLFWIYSHRKEMISWGGIRDNNIGVFVF
jgi:hypothetical protein